MTEMIERVARAIASEVYPNEVWKKSKDKSMEAAVRAILEMSHPTEKMLDVAATGGEDCWSRHKSVYRDGRRHIYSAMIKSALGKE